MNLNHEILRASGTVDVTATNLIRHLSLQGSTMKKTITTIARAMNSAYLKVSVAVATLAGSVLPAQATSLGNAITNGKNDASAAVGLVIAVAAVAGAGFIFYGGMQLKKKGGDRGEDVTWNSIVLPMLGGTVCLCIALIAGIWAEEFGGNQNSMGQGIAVRP
jgi:hypothetical protein